MNYFTLLLKMEMENKMKMMKLKLLKMFIFFDDFITPCHYTGRKNYNMILR